jgi:hypothetical protein
MAAKKTSTQAVKAFRRKVKKRRPGVHSKNKAGRHKGSKNYLKKYKGQGKR